jgi:GAF domain-containing protein
LSLARPPLMPPLADTATWIAVGFAVAAALLALGASLVLLGIVLRRGRAAAGAGRPGGGGPLSGRRDLADALEDAALDAAMLSVQQVEDEPFVATVGMTAEEASRQPVATGPPGGARAVRISYRYGPDDEGGLREAGSELIRGGVAVPVREGEGNPLGTLAVFWRNEDRGPEEGEVARLEQLAATSAPAIRNAQRFREARERSYAQRRASRRAASCSRRRTSVCTSSRNRAQSDWRSAERKCPGGAV